MIANSGYVSGYTEKRVAEFQTRQRIALIAQQACRTIKSHLSQRQNDAHLRHQRPLLR